MKKVMLGFLCGVVLMLAVGFTVEKLNVKYVDYKVLVNGKETTLKNQPLLKDGGTTYLPLRELAEVAGYKVGFNKNEGVISLNDSAPTTSTATPQPTPSIQSSSTPQAEAIVWKKLPQTWEQDGISITVHSISVDTSTDFDVTITNNRDTPLLLGFNEAMRSNQNVEGKESVLHGYVRNQNFHNPEVSAGETISGTVKKGKISEGTENVVLSIKVAHSRYAIFYIDTTDLWK